MKVAFKFTKAEVEAEMVLKAESIGGNLHVDRIIWGSYGSCEVEVIMTDEVEKPIEMPHTRATSNYEESF